MAVILFARQTDITALQTAIGFTLGMIPGALTATGDTNVTITLGGTPATALLQASSITIGWTGTLAASRLNSNVVQSVINDTNITGSIATQTLTLGWSGTLAAGRLNSNVVQAVVNDTNIQGTISAQTLTFAWSGTLAAARLNSNVVQSITNDTNITGTISAQNLTLGWQGTLAAGRLNSNVVQAITNDTNITGSISTQNLTLGWSGQLGVPRGGTGLATLTAHAVMLGEGTSNVAFATIGTAGRLLIDQGASADPAFTAVSGDATIAGTGALTLGANVVSNSKFRQSAGLSVVGNSGAATANIADITGTAGQGLFVNAAGTSLSFASFLQSGTGATNRSWLSKAQDIVSVLDFGADPTGNTDSTTAIQNAINSLPNSGGGGQQGGTVYFPPGVYKISSVLSITVSGTRLVGAGAWASIISNTSSTTGIISITSAASSGQCGVRDLFLAGNSTSIPTNGIAIQCNAVNCHFENLVIAGGYDGILLQSASTNCTIRGCKITQLYGTVYVQASGGGGHVIEGNMLDPFFFGGTINTSTTFVSSWSTSHSFAANTALTLNGGLFYTSAGGTSASSGTGPVATAFGAAITDGTVTWYYLGNAGLEICVLSATNSNFIANNDMSGPAAYAIVLQSSAGSNRIIGNTLGQNVNGAGIAINSGMQNVVSANWITQTFYGGSNGYGIVILDADNLVIGNNINQTGNHSILIDGTGTAVVGNKFSGWGVNLASWGVIVNAGVTDFQITDNSFRSPTNASGAIDVQSGASDYYVITNNLVHGNAVTDSGTGTHKTVSGNN